MNNILENMEKALYDYWSDEVQDMDKADRVAKELQKALNLINMLSHELDELQQNK